MRSIFVRIRIFCLNRIIRIFRFLGYWDFLSESGFSRLEDYQDIRMHYSVYYGHRSYRVAADVDFLFDRREFKLTSFFLVRFF